MGYKQNILIVEDDDIQQEELARSIHAQNPALTIHTAKNNEEAVDCLINSITTASLYQLFLLDIHLSENTDKMEGFQFAKLIRSHTVYQFTPIIFLTSNHKQIEFALNHFHCYNYIRKPYNSVDIANQINQLLLSYQMTQQSFFIKDTDRIAHRIQRDNILYLESNGHTLKIVCSNTTIITRDATLSSMKKKIGEGFFQCHKRYVVNTSLIENYDSICSNIQIKNHVIPVGRVYKDRLFENIHIM